jgi:hypothetical protein
MKQADIPDDSDSNDFCSRYGHDFQNIRGIGRICTRCGEGADYEPKVKIKPVKDNEGK